MTDEKKCLDPYERFQMERYGNIVSDYSPYQDLFENGIEELRRLAEWTEAQVERELLSDR